MIYILFASDFIFLFTIKAFFSNWGKLDVPSTFHVNFCSFLIFPDPESTDISTLPQLPARDRHVYSFLSSAPGGGGGNAIYVPYGDVPPIRVYFLAFESETGCLFSSLALKQGAKFVRSIRARVPIHSTVWHPHVGFNLFVFCSGN